MNGRINVAEPPKFMVSCRRPGRSKRPGMAPIPPPHSPQENTHHKAGVEGESEILTALAAAIAVTAERSGAAALDGAHDLVLRPGDAGTAALEEPLGEGAKDNSHLQSRPVHEAAGSCPVCPARSNVCSGLGADFNFRVDRCR